MLHFSGKWREQENVERFYQIDGEKENPFIYKPPTPYSKRKDRLQATHFGTVVFGSQFNKTRTHQIQRNSV